LDPSTPAKLVISTGAILLLLNNLPHIQSFDWHKERDAALNLKYDRAEESLERLLCISSIKRDP
jgi:hypothetical protein